MSNTISVHNQKTTTSGKYRQFVKNIFKGLSLGAICMLLHSKAHGQANTGLSNLIPTAVNQSLIPGTNNTRDLGSSALKWRTLYLSSGAVLSDNIILKSNTNNNILFGSMATAMGGSDNIAIGQNAGYINSTGNSNVFIGKDAGTLNSSGHSNIFIGKAAGFNSNALSGLVFIGDSAGYSNNGNNQLDGQYNTFIGMFSGKSNTIGYDNLFLGYKSGFGNNTGKNNTFLGAGCGSGNTSGNYNTYSGVSSGGINSTGTDNSFFGYLTGLSNVGSNNTGMGSNTLLWSQTGVANTAMGSWAGFGIGTGSNNTFVGYLTTANSSAISNATAIGSGAAVTSSNQVRIGNTAITSIGGYKSWTTLPSDGRFKKNVKEEVKGLDFIMRLRPVTYTLDIEAIEKVLQPAMDGKPERQRSPEEIQARMEKEKEIQTGFIAQEVEKAAKDAGYVFSGVDAPDNEKDVYGVRYAEFVVPLVKAVQELSGQNDQMKAQNEKLESQINQLMVEVAALKETKAESKSNPEYNEQEQEAFLAQNVPNPFDHSTIIEYKVPQHCEKAEIRITETSTGQLIKTIPVSCSGSQISVDLNGYRNGIYSYSLVIDGKVIETRQMMLTR